MKSEITSIQLGDTAVSIFTISHLMADLAEWYQLSAADVSEEIRPYHSH